MQAAKMVDLDTGISNAVAQLHVNLSKVAGLPPAEKDGIQAAIGASIVQLQLPVACIDGITGQVLGQFRKVAQQARLR